MADRRITPVASPLISPAFRTQGNLTGVPRKCKDNCAEVHNIIQKWNGVNIEGLEILKQIISARSTENNQFKEESDDIDELLGNEVLGDKNNFEKIENIQTLFEKLRSFHNQMESLKEKLELLTVQFKALSKLQSKVDSELDRTVNYCSNTVEEISKCYSEEFDLKRTIIENAAHAKNRNEEMFLLAAWTHQPYINKDIDFKLKVMLTETGFQ